MHTLNILSLNVNGLNSAVKRTRVLEYLHHKSISCALIQKTHLKQSDVARFQNKYYKLAAFSLNPALDKSQSDTTANPSSKLLNKFITELNLIDIWRIQNTKSKDFTFFSNRHKTFSRIDYIFLSPSLI